MHRPILTEGPERRGAPRKVLRTAATVRLPDGRTFDARTIDISLSGLGFACDRNLPPRLACLVEFALAIEGEPRRIEVSGAVTHTVFSAQHGLFTVGMKFATLPAELSAAIARYVSSQAIGD